MVKICRDYVATCQIHVKMAPLEVLVQFPGKEGSRVIAVSMLVFEGICRMTHCCFLIGSSTIQEVVLNLIGSKVFMKIRSMALSPCGK